MTKPSKNSNAQCTREKEKGCNRLPAPLSVHQSLVSRWAVSAATSSRLSSPLLFSTPPSLSSSPLRNFPRSRPKSHSLSLSLSLARLPPSARRSSRVRSSFRKGMEKGAIDGRSPSGGGTNDVMADAYQATRDAITQLYTLALDQHRLGDRGRLVKLYQWIVARQGAPLTEADVITYIQNELGETGGDVSDTLTLQTPQHPEYVPAPIGDIQYDPDFPYLEDFQ